MPGPELLKSAMLARKGIIKPGRMAIGLDKCLDDK
jgi:hypothetical protein